MKLVKYKDTPYIELKGKLFVVTMRYFNIVREQMMYRIYCKEDRYLTGIEFVEIVEDYNKLKI